MIIGNAIYLGGTPLPSLNNPASTSDILDGKEAIDGQGQKLTGSLVHYEPIYQELVTTVGDANLKDILDSIPVRLKWKISTFRFWATGSTAASAGATSFNNLFATHSMQTYIGREYYVSGNVAPDTTVSGKGAQNLTRIVIATDGRVTLSVGRIMGGNGTKVYFAESPSTIFDNKYVSPYQLWGAS